jgi:hypothetical protein
LFNDLLGGGWRRTVALSSVGLVTAGFLLAVVAPSSSGEMSRAWRATSSSIWRGSRGAKEVLLFDKDRVLRAHWAGGEWRAPSDWAAR